MSDLNMANRQCCDVDIREYSTNRPWGFYDSANVTTVGFTADTTFAMEKGAKSIAFANPMEGTMTMELQVHPFKLYSLFSDGTIGTSTVLPKRERIQCAVAGQVTATGTPVSGTMYVYADNDYAGTALVGTVAGSVFTATTPAHVALNSYYEVTYLEAITSGIKSISFDNTKALKDFRVTMETLDKDENGDLVPVKITAFKASPKRNMSLSFSSEGDPATLTIEFDCLVDSDQRVLEMVEIDDVDSDQFTKIFASPSIITLANSGTRQITTYGLLGDDYVPALLDTADLTFSEIADTSGAFTVSSTGLITAHGSTDGSGQILVTLTGTSVTCVVQVTVA